MATKKLFHFNTFSFLLLIIFVYNFSNCNKKPVIIDPKRESIKLQLLVTGQSFLKEKKISLAFQSFEKYLKMAKKDENSQQIATGYYQLSILYLKIKEYKKALNYSERSIKLYEDSDDFIGYSESQRHTGDILYNQGEIDKSFQQYEKSLVSLRKLKSSKDPKIQKQIIYITGLTHRGFAKVYQSKKNWRMAIQSFQASQKSLDQLISIDFLSSDIKIENINRDDIPLINIISINYNDIALSFISIKKFDKAKNNFEKAIKLAKLTNNYKNLSASLNNYGEALAKLGRINEAYDVYQESLSLQKLHNLPHIKTTEENIRKLKEIKFKLEKNQQKNKFSNK